MAMEQFASWRSAGAGRGAVQRASAQYFTAPETKTVAPPGLEGVGIDQRLNEQVPLNLTFKDEQGKTVQLGDYFHHGRPVILNLVYYQCPMLCTEVLNGLTSALKVIGLCRASNLKSSP